MQDLKSLEDKIQLVKDDLLSRLPGVPHTVTVLLWDDNTSLIECRHGDGTHIHTSTYYNGSLEYKSELMMSGSMMKAADGKSYFAVESPNPEDEMVEYEMEALADEPEDKEESPDPDLFDCYEIRKQKVVTLTEPKTVRLIEFDVENLNGRSYSKEVVEPLLEGLNEYPIFGEITNGWERMKLSRVSQITTNIRIEGRYLKGDIQVVDSEEGRRLLADIDNYVFRSRGIGDVVDGKVVKLDILAFDAIIKEDDSFQMSEETELEMLVNTIKAEIK